MAPDQLKPKQERLIVGFTLVLTLVDQALKIISNGSANVGIAFGLGEPILVWIGLILFLVLLVFTRGKPRSLWISLAIASLSNLIDRVRTGGVIDYLNIGALQLNIADILICLFVALIGLSLIKKGA